MNDMQGGVALAPMWGAVPAGAGDWAFALWAPSAGRVELRLGRRLLPLERDPQGVHRGRYPAAEGMAYAFVVDGQTISDPASRRQEGVEPPSLLFDPARLRRNRRPFPDRPMDEMVVCEIHIGSFTPEGTFRAAARSPALRRLADLGVTAVELMPVGLFPGRQGWGYDGVLPHAPFAPYGSPEDLAALVDAIHGLGMCAWLDVVFNHFGPQGCHLVAACPEFFREDSNDWGRSIDFAKAPVREYFIACALCWTRDYGFDGLRFDAADRLADDGDPPFLHEMARRLRAGNPGRPIHLMTEDCRNINELIEPSAGLYDAEWNDDYHHALHVLLTGETQHYYRPYAGGAALGHLCLALREGRVWQGQPKRDGTRAKGDPSGRLPWSSMINFNLNHDQAGNRARGERLITLVGQETALVAHALLLSAPWTPMIFMGEEAGSQAPFPWFADFSGQLAKDMCEGRVKHFGQEPGFAEQMIPPMDPDLTRLACPYAGAPSPVWLEATGDLLRLRREVLLPLYRSGRAGPAEARPCGPRALTVRWPCRDGTVRLAACFGGAQLYSETRHGAPLFALGQPGDGRPSFRLWVE